MAKKTRKVGRSAKSGQFVSKDELQKHPAETILDTVPVGERKTTADVIKDLCIDLNFQSETDAPVEVFISTAVDRSSVDCEVMKALTGHKECEPLDFDKWFEKNSKPEVQPQSETYHCLHVVMVERLVQRKVFKMTITPHRYAYYAIGVQRDCSLLGIRTEFVET